MSPRLWKPAVDAWFAAHHGAITTQTMRNLGASASTIARMAQRGDLARIAGGVYRHPATPLTDLPLMSAACQRFADVMVGFTSACSEWGLRGIPDCGVRMLAPHGVTPEIEGVIVHRSRRIDPVDRVERVDGIRLTSPPRSLCDAADLLGIAACSSALEQLIGNYCTLATVVDTFVRLAHPQRPGTRTMQAVLRSRQAWRSALQSDLERRVLDEIRRQHLPMPVPQFRLRLPDGADIHLDFAWPEARVAVEVDHPAWHAGATQSHRDKHRDRKAATVGWLTARVTDLDVRSGLPEAIADLAAILALRSAA